MSPRPRAFGEQPGRLIATMLRALAAELSDPGRYARAKNYARDGAVFEIDIRPGAVSGLVMGSRRLPYEVLLAVDPAAADEIAGADRGAVGSMALLVPGGEELEVSCTCPDADGAAGPLCKHAIALLLVFADEVSADPLLLARWRTADPDGASWATDTHRLPARGRPVSTAPTRVDMLAGLLDSPTLLPALPAIARRAVARPSSVVLADPVVRLLDELHAEAVALTSRRR
jgi:hypothetical protein